MRRNFLACFVFALMFTLSGCDENDTPKRIADAHSEAEQLKAEIDELKSRIDDLRSEVDHFDDENWREVVPKVKSALEEVERESDSATDMAESLENNLGQLESDTTPTNDDDYQSSSRDRFFMYRSPSNARLALANASAPFPETSNHLSVFQSHLHRVRDSNQGHHPRSVPSGDL